MSINHSVPSTDICAPVPPWMPLMCGDMVPCCSHGGDQQVHGLVYTDMPLTLFCPSASPAPLDQTCTFMLPQWGDSSPVESRPLADPQLLQLDHCPECPLSRPIIEVSEEMIFVYILCVNVTCVTLTNKCSHACVCLCVQGCTLAWKCVESRV